MLRKPDADVLSIETTGGVGNQLFQFASGYGIAKIHGLKLALDNTWFAARSLRSFELNLTYAHYIDITRHERSAVMGRRLRYRTELTNGHLARYLFRHVEFEDETGFNHRYRNSPPRRISGYLQSWRYFSEVSREVRAQISELRNPSDWYLAERERIASGDYGRWIALHVRHGDYLEPPYRSSIGPLDVDYYRTAMSRLGSGDSWDTVVVFSDNPNVLEWTGALTRLPTVRFRSEVGTPSIETLLLMSLADGVVCANSTFGWWAGWLGDRPDRPVAVPSPWFANSYKDSKDYLWPGWIRIKRDERNVLT